MIGTFESGMFQALELFDAFKSFMKSEMESKR